LSAFFLQEEAPPARAVAALRDSAGGQVGKVDIQEAASGKLQLRLSVQGLTTGSNFGLSIHKDGDCASLGPVFKPDQVKTFLQKKIDFFSTYFI
jgi:Cu/Zn superoxide dismutase